YRTREGEEEPFYVPSFLVQVGPDPKSMKPLWDVTRVTYKDAVNQIDSFELTVASTNWDPRSIRYTGQLPPSTSSAESPMAILPGSYCRLWLGYETKVGLYPMLTGRVTSVAPMFVDGAMTVTVRALSS